MSRNDPISFKIHENARLRPSQNGNNYMNMKMIFSYRLLTWLSTISFDDYLWETIILSFIHFRFERN